MLEFQDDLINFKYNSQEYSFRIPSPSEYDLFTKEMRKKDDNNIEASFYLKHLVSWGLDEEISSRLSVRQVTQLVQAVTESFSKKK